MSDGTLWVCARRINTAIPDIEKLNLSPTIMNHMLGLGKRDGLIVISGATGQGKTTTAVNLAREQMRRGEAQVAAQRQRAHRRTIEKDGPAGQGAFASLPLPLQGDDLVDFHRSEVSIRPRP